ncbi:DUF4184 family protein [Streptomyces sp. GC420]|uniref:DUF4184 family protein n=1 Tax=Streptomyces sp. GC420 TaxID=2697568 RepID=UPI001414EF08|nr:DUF4184 family protein [Streptomyces sp. GC420]NBM16811.1 DUF4184 family protein [Streptomyces sp. GC420]
MPFTLSHAAAVLPGIRRSGAARGGLIASALVAGSFSPDLTYYAASVVPGAMEFGDFTHGPLGVFTADVLLTALLVGLWLLLREPLVALVVPEAWRGRVYGVLAGRSLRGRGALPLACAFYTSAVIGAGTHVVWDAFTHLDRWGMRVLPVLGEEIAGSPLYWYAQYGGSAVAFVVIVWFLVSAVRRQDGPVGTPAALPRPTRGERIASWAALAVCVLLAAAHRCLRWWAYHGADAKAYEIIPTFCFGAGAGLAAALPLFALAIRLRHPARHSSPARHEPSPQPSR